jgi:D-glycero-alpha-D-manno-heptose-7-phosphate kinase
MLLTKTPLRVSFFGGGSDLPSYYNHHDGLCVSTTIDSFVYLAINQCVAPHLKVIYSALELVKDVDDIKHSRVREALRHFDFKSNMEICSFSDVPHKGTGLGSSSTFTVGLVKALFWLKYRRRIPPEELAELAAYIEINRCAEAIGKQDQYAAAFGGFKAYAFYKDGVAVKPVVMDPATKLALEDHLFFFNTGIGRKASLVLEKQAVQTGNGERISELVEMAKHSLDLLKNGKVHDFGRLLHDSWELKKKLGGVTNAQIDEMYETAIKAGALGGKVLGAGGGGYMMFYVPRSHRSHVLDALRYYEHRDFRFFNKGSTIEYDQSYLSRSNQYVY